MWMPDDRKYKSGNAVADMQSELESGRGFGLLPGSDLSLWTLDHLSGL
jgi:hypothetical protein